MFRRRIDTNKLGAIAVDKPEKTGRRFSDPKMAFLLGVTMSHSAVAATPELVITSEAGSPVALASSPSLDDDGLIKIEPAQVVKQEERTIVSDPPTVITVGASSQQRAETAASVDSPARQANASPFAGRVPATDFDQSERRMVSYDAPTGSAPPREEADADPDKLLSLFQDGPGQAQTSTDEIDLVIGGMQVFTDLRTLEMRLNDMSRPTFNVVDRRSTQSDKLVINQFEVSQDLFFLEGRDSLRLAFQKTDYSLMNVTGINEYTGGLTGNVRVDDVAAIAGELWVNRIDYGRQRSTIPTYDVFATIRPTDTIRIDIDGNRRTFDNIRSLQLGITAQSYGGSIDFIPADGLRLTARAFAGLYTDANRKRSEELEAVWRIRSNPIVEVGLRGTNFQFSRLLNNGYFNPRNYYSGEAMFRVQYEATSQFTVEAAGSGGAEEADPGGVKPLIKGSLQAVYKLSNRWSIEAEASHFTSRSSNSSGFARTSLTAGLHYRF